MEEKADTPKEEEAEDKAADLPTLMRRYVTFPSIAKVRIAIPQTRTDMICSMSCGMT